MAPLKPFDAEITDNNVGNFHNEKVMAPLKRLFKVGKCRKSKKFP